MPRRRRAMTNRRISRRRGKDKVGSRRKESGVALSRKVGIVVGAVLIVIAAGALLWGTIDRLLCRRRSPQRDKRSVASQQPHAAAPPRQRQSLSAEPKLTPEEQDRSLRKEQIEIGRRLSATFPDNANAAFLMGMAYLEQNNVVEAVKHLERSLELQPDRADAYDHLGRVALAKGECDRASPEPLYAWAITKKRFRNCRGTLRCSPRPVEVTICSERHT